MARSAPKAKTIYACAECGQTSPKWLGQCPACRQWNTMQEEVAAPEPKGAAPRGWGLATTAKPILLRDVEARDEERQRTGIGELDRVLGGGVVPGSLVLLGGDPALASPPCSSPPSTGSRARRRIVRCCTSRARSRRGR
jgi:DNA repair protein RadA/Sms